MWQVIILICALSSGECTSFNIEDRWFETKRMCKNKLILRWEEIVESRVLSQISGGYHVHLACEKRSQKT